MCEIKLKWQDVCKYQKIILLTFLYFVIFIVKIELSFCCIYHLVFLSAKIIMMENIQGWWDKGTQLVIFISKVHILNFQEIHAKKKLFFSRISHVQAVTINGFEIDSRIFLDHEIATVNLASRLTLVFRRHSGFVQSEVNWTKNSRRSWAETTSWVHKAARTHSSSFGDNKRAAVNPLNFSLL